MQSRIQLAFWAASAHCRLSSSFSPPVPPSPSRQGCSQSLHPPAWTYTEGCQDPRTGPWTLLCATSWGSHGPTPSACPGLSGCRPVPQVCQLHHSAWCHLQTCWGFILSLCLNEYMNTDEYIKQCWSQQGPLRDTTCHWHPFGHWTVGHYSLDATIQTIPYPLNSPPIKSISLQFRKKDVVGNHVKGLTEIQMDDIHSSSLVHSGSHFITEGH